MKESPTNPLLGLRGEDHFHKSAIAIASKLRIMTLEFSRGNVEELLRLSEAYCGFLFLNHLGVLADINFELEIANKLESIFPQKNNVKPDGVLHLATNIYEFGGHSGVINRLLNTQSNQSLAVLGTIPKKLKLLFPVDTKLHQNLKKPRRIHTIKSILETCERYESVVLHIDSNDILSAISAILLSRRGVKIYTYNHADHAFGVGYAAAEAVFEISKLGWLNGGKRNISKKQSFVGIPIDFQDELNEVLDCQEEEILIVGSDEKFQPIKGYDMADVLNKLYKDKIFNKKFHITVCGTEGKKEYWKKLYPKLRNKINFTGRVDYGKYKELLLKTTIYIDSFPLANGTAFAQAVARGVPAFGINLYAGYSCVDAMRNYSTEELLNTIKSYVDDPASYLNKIMKFRSQLIKEQSIEACKSRIDLAMNQKVKLKLPASMYSIKCNNLYFDERWRSRKKIILPLMSIGKLSFKCQLMIVSCLIAAIPYIRVNPLLLIKKYFNLGKLIELK